MDEGVDEMETNEILIGKAKFESLGNDLFWDFCKYDGSMPDHFIELKWSGYNDANWWNNVSLNADVVEQGGRRFRIDFITDDVYEVTDHA